MKVIKITLDNNVKLYVHELNYCEYSKVYLAMCDGYLVCTLMPEEITDITELEN